MIIKGLITGIAAGILSSLVGIGGGIIIVPALIYFFKIDMHVATGTSLAIIIPTALVGVIVHGINGNVNLKLAALLALGGIIGSYTGGQISTSLPSSTVKKIFSIILIMVAIKFSIDAFNLD
ncbi:MAG: sulfite exporter TauE/SafE family protein [Desulfitobacteriaceae bacterium]|nr:sulfite exporter TauE/SafE family protein [Desulfitobacteriaceae bacterium]